MSSNAGVHLVLRCVGPGIVLPGIAGFRVFHALLGDGDIVVRALGNLAM